MSRGTGFALVLLLAGAAGCAQSFDATSAFLDTNSLSLSSSTSRSKPVTSNGLFVMSMSLP